MRKRSGILSKLYVAAWFAFFYLPIVVTVIFSFNSSKSLSRLSGFSMRWYSSLLSNGEIVNAVYVSVTIAILATVISTVLGTMTAIGLSRSRKVLRDAILSMNDIPILNPDIVTAISWMLLFSSMGLQKGYLTMLLAHIGFCTPFVITSVYPKVRGLDPNLANAAMDLGATPVQALTKVIIPMIRPGIFAGALLAFTMSFDDFVISYFVTGNGVKNISENDTVAIDELELEIGENDSLAAIVAGLGVLMHGVGASSQPAVLRVYNAGEYLEPGLLEQFQEEYDCTVIYETFESNEMMYTKLQAGDEYDVLVPSDYMIERLIREEYLQPIDWSLIENKDKINPDIMNRSYDPGNVYSVPYFWGSVGILYDTTVVDEEDLEEGWNLLMNPKYAGNIYMYDSERDSFMVALKALGYSMNTDNEEEIREAYDWLIRQRETMNPIYAGDDAMDNMIAGNKAISVTYSGDAAYAMTENEDLDYFEPEEGTNLWYDSLVITKNCENVELAHAFIDFLEREESAEANTLFIGYTPSVLSVYEEMQETEFEGIGAYVPRVGHENDEIFAYQEPKVKKLYAELWTKVKAQ